MHDCPCCGFCTYVSDNVNELCPECLDAGCVITHDCQGEPGYWACERVDIWEDEDYDDDSYDEYPEEHWGADPYDIEYYR